VRGQAGSNASLWATGGGLYLYNTARGVLQWCNVSSNVVTAVGSSVTEEAAAVGGGMAILGSTGRVNLTSTWVQDNMAQQTGAASPGASTMAVGGGVAVWSTSELWGEGKTVFRNNRAQVRPHDPLHYTHKDNFTISYLLTFLN
jgi:hypothetical protein